jgi:hypothetical protein
MATAKLRRVDDASLSDEIIYKFTERREFPAAVTRMKYGSGSNGYATQATVKLRKPANALADFA